MRAAPDGLRRLDEDIGGCRHLDHGDAGFCRGKNDKVILSPFSR